MRLEILTLCLSLFIQSAIPCAARADDGGFISGQVDDGLRNEAKSLTPDRLKAFSAWLIAHQSSWRPNFATPPLPLLTVTLDKPTMKAALRVDVWPGQKRPGWSHVVLLHDADSRAIGIQTLSADDLSALLHILK
jgi:hypothetical protein